ncbi:MAG TPA: hypothetical protein DCF33_04400, partial [Saprospirales bacterium]|nr:hypothetical protein [Saprospirales bacterium]
KPFFQKKKLEFNAWLRQNQLGHMLKADSVAVEARKVTLFLRPTYNGKRTCDSLQCAWQGLEKANKQINGQTFHERLLHKWAFLAEIHENQAEVIIRCHEPPHFHARVYTKGGRVPVDERNIRSGAITSVKLPASMQGINSGENFTMLRDKNLGTVCTKARQWLVNQYKTKGTPILWKAKVDTSYTAYDEFVLEVTHLNNEICPDGYFEYHRVYVKGVQKGPDVELTWEFQGKYGSGIVFPPRKNDYKDMELKYKSNLEEYQKRLFKRMLDYLR